MATPPTSLRADHHDQARPNDARKTASRPLWLRGRSSCSPISDPAQSALDVAACASSRTALGADISLLTGTGGGIGTPGPGRRAGDPELRQDSYYPEWLLERRRRAEWALASVVATSYRLGVSTRRAEKLAKGMGVTKLSKSQVSVMTAELDEMVAGSGPGRWMPAPRARPCPRSRPSTTRTRTRVVVGAVPCWGMNLGRHPAVVKVAALRSRRAGGGDQMTAPRAPGAGQGGWPGSGCWPPGWPPRCM